MKTLDFHSSIVWSLRATSLFAVYLFGIWLIAGFMSFAKLTPAAKTRPRGLSDKE
jgi:hypothetical protein